MSWILFQCIVEQSGKEMVVRNCTNQSLAVRNIPLFDVLKHMESQFDHNLPPPDVETYQSYSTSALNQLPAYTGILCTRAKVNEIVSI